MSALIDQTEIPDHASQLCERNAGALRDLHMSALAAKGFRRSWLELDAYLINILRVLNAEGLHDNELSERQDLLPISD